LSRYEFDGNTPKVRRSLNIVDYRARFTSLDSLNRCFHRSAVTAEDLSNSFTVTAKCTDYGSGETHYQAVTIAVPPGSSITRLTFATVFESYCDALAALLEGKRCDLDDGGNDWPSYSLPGLTHDSRVYARRDVLNRSLKWVTMRSEEVLEMFRYSGHYRHEHLIHANSVSDYGMDTHLALLLFILDFRAVIVFFGDLS
jgi:hypothetical protein